MYDDDDGFFLNPDADADERWLTPLWLLAGFAWLLTLGGTILGTAWTIRQALRAG